MPTITLSAFRVRPPGWGTSETYLSSFQKTIEGDKTLTRSSAGVIVVTLVVVTAHFMVGRGRSQCARIARNDFGQPRKQPSRNRGWLSAWRLPLSAPQADFSGAAPGLGSTQFDWWGHHLGTSTELSAFHPGSDRHSLSRSCHLQRHGATFDLDSEQIAADTLD